MSEKPILFNTKMVRAILDGRKIETRRILKQLTKDGKIFDDRPPYLVGDILYVRETWQKLINVDANDKSIPESEHYYYKADCEQPSSNKMPWKPSIHMPKKAARIWLRVTDITIERLQDMDTKEWENEGLLLDAKKYKDHYDYYEALKDEWIKLWNSTIKKQYFDRYGWDANPWVWVIKFERIGEYENETGNHFMPRDSAQEGCR